MGEKVQGIRSIIGRHKIGEVKNNIGNGEAKDLVCPTYGHELSKGGGDWRRVGRCRARKF